MYNIIKYHDFLLHHGEVANDVCFMRRVGGWRRNGSEWWNEDVRERAVAEKRRAFVEWLQRRDRVTYDRFRAHRVVVKRGVQVAKRMADHDEESDGELFRRHQKDVLERGKTSEER